MSITARQAANGLEKYVALLPSQLSREMILMLRLARKKAITEFMLPKSKTAPVHPTKLTKRTGRGARSVKVGRVQVRGREVVGELLAGGANAPYMGIHETGGQTRPHVIRPLRARVLAFMQNGALRFARSVNHPGSNIPARPYLKPAGESLRDEWPARVRALNARLKKAVGLPRA